MSESIESFMNQLKNFISTDTIIGEKIELTSEISAIPVIKVTFGLGGGSGENSKENDQRKGSIGVGGGGSIVPIAFLIIENGEVKLLRIQEKASLPEKIIAEIPQLIRKFASSTSKQESKKKKKKEN